MSLHVRPATHRPTQPQHALRRRALLLVATLCLVTGSYGVVLSAPIDSTVTTARGPVEPTIVSGYLDHPVSASFSAHGTTARQMSIDHLTIAEFTIQPGGDAGWQRHGGPVWVIVERGTLTLYVEQDQSCDAVGYASGSAFLVSGNVRHTMRNEERELLRFHLVSMLAERESMRSDGSMPTHCRFQAKRAKP